MTLYDLPLHHFVGNAQNMGLAQGETFKSKLKELIQLRLEHLCNYKNVAQQDLKTHYTHSVQNMWSLLKKNDPHAYQQCRSILTASDVDSIYYLLCANITDFRDQSLDPEGCTSAVFKDNYGHMIGAQTWDLGSNNLPYVVMVHEQPEHGIERWTLNCYGFPALMGMNAHGVSIGTTNIKTRDIGPGLGYVHLIDKALKNSSARLACEQFRSLPRYASHTYWVIDEQDGYQIDTGHEFFQSTCLINEPLIRTNHPIPKELQLQQLEKASNSSLLRLEKAQFLFECPIKNVSTIQNILSDRSHGKNSISRLEEDGEGVATNACFIANPKQRTIWACRGPAQKGQWHRLGFNAIYDKQESA